jgi:hypothetical protein
VKSPRVRGGDACTIGELDEASELEDKVHLRAPVLREGYQLYKGSELFWGVREAAAPDAMRWISRHDIYMLMHDS